MVFFFKNMFKTAVDWCWLDVIFFFRCALGKGCFFCWILFLRFSWVVVDPNWLASPQSVGHQDWRKFFSIQTPHQQKIRCPFALLIRAEAYKSWSSKTEAKMWAKWWKHLIVLLGDVFFWGEWNPILFLAGSILGVFTFHEMDEFEIPEIPINQHWSSWDVLQSLLVAPLLQEEKRYLTSMI